MVKILHTKESVLDKEKLKEYLAKLAADNSIRDGSEDNTYPIPRLKDNFEYISLVYTLLVEHTKIDIPIHPAGEWILDNYYIIENSIKSIEKELKKKKYVKLPGISNSGFARVYVLANEIISNCDAKIDDDDLIEYLNSYQTQKNLKIEEILSVNIFLQLSIIEKIRHICEKIFVSQMQKFKVENIVKRLVDGEVESKFERSMKEKTFNGEYEFVEYMSYKLKRYGDAATPYLKILEDEAKKIGMSVMTIIEREHFDVAIKKLSIKNCITSLKKIQRMDMLNIYDNASLVEKIVSKDPSNVYPIMDYDTKTYYRNAIIKLAKKTDTSEIYVAEKALSLANKHSNDEEVDKHSHIGYYLIDNGVDILLSELKNKQIRTIKSEKKSILYVLLIYSTSIILTFLISKIIGWFSILFIIPTINSFTKLIQYILGKINKTKIIPKINLKGCIPDESKTMCAIPVILKDKITVNEMFRKMEIYYLANKSKNLYFTLLGDCKTSNLENEKKDYEIIQEGCKCVEELNEKYNNIFNFVYRKREWSDSEKCYMGWERKRGLINQFNEYLKTGKSKFATNTFKEIPKIKYVIVLDSDTNLTLNSAFKLVGAMEHILNKPEIDKATNIVKSGHGIIQPRIGLDIEEGRKNSFTRLFSGNGGTDLYANAISDVYQDNFDEGIYIGKGIYDLDTFYEVLKDSIPENKVLSHDLLEGNFLRCGLASDINLLDGCPSNYLSYKVRQDRWIRGDIQILPWIRSKLNLLSKYKIIDNIIRNSNDIFLTLSFLLGFFTKIYSISTITILIMAIPMVIELLDRLFNEKIEIKTLNMFTVNNSKLEEIIYSFLMQILLLPDRAFMETIAISKSIYRMYITHNYLLEWTTADEAERMSKNNIIKYYDSMLLEVIIGLILAISRNCIFSGVGIAWIFAPLILYVCGKKEVNSKKISIQNEKYLITIGQSTWRFFRDNMINYLPTDNYQEDRKEKIVKRTSPTNIGLGLMAVVASYDLGYENIEETIKLTKNMMDTIEKLPKWNGHLYNWYDIENLQPINPLDVSSVDSGNFVGYLYTVKGFYYECINKKVVNDNQYEIIKGIIKEINFLIANTDFSKLYDEKVGLFSIGYSMEENKLYDSYYDLLASESRQTSLVAIAKKDVEEKHWHNLSRTLTEIYGHKGLVSWGGTAFEYLMPNINIPTFESTIIDESCRLSVLSQIKYSKKLGIPWGISEAAYSKKDLFGNYQYKTFGIPWLGLKRGLGSEAVISPYSTIMALTISSDFALNNLHKIEKEGGIGKYGFFDSIDYVPKKTVVKTYMAHHQGMIITSIDNCVNDNIFQKRFMNNPEIAGIKVLLEETMPDNAVITKEKKDKAQKIKYNMYDENVERKEGLNSLATRKYLNVITDNGEEYSNAEGICLYKDEIIYIKDINSKKIRSSIDIDIDNSFYSYMTKQKMEDGNIKITINTTIAPDSQVEIKEIKLENRGITDLNLEITDLRSIILSNLKQYKSHPSFDKMFLRFNNIDGIIGITRKSRMQNEKIMYMQTSMYEINSENQKYDFEINKEKIYKRGETGIPKSIIDSIPFSNRIEDVINPILAMKKIIFLKPGEIKKIYIVTSAEDNEKKAKIDIQNYMNNESLERAFELAKVQTEAENRYLQVSGKAASIYQAMLNELIRGKIEKDKKLWKYGISGDYPILSISIKEYNDYYVIDEIMKAYEYYLSKNININIVIITYPNIYADIFENIVKEGMLKYLNTSTGIFILNDLKREERLLIEARSKLIIDADNCGTLELQFENGNFINKNSKNKINSKKQNKKITNGIKTKEKIENSKIIDNKTSNYNENNLETTISDENEQNIENIARKMNLKLFNGYGGFSQDYSEYCIIQNKNNRIPVAWSNIMANQNFGTVITDSYGGFTWYENSRTNRITKFENDAYMDKSSEIIYFDMDEKRWSTSLNYMPDNNEYITKYGFGYSIFNHISCELIQNITTFVPEKINSKITIINLKNQSISRKNIKIKYDIDYILGENDDGALEIKYNPSLNMNIVKNNSNQDYCVYVSSNEIINENNEIKIELAGLEEKDIILVMGAETNEDNCIEKSAECTNNYKKLLNQTKKYWSELVGKIKSDTPSQAFDALQNGWLVYQTICSRLIAKTGFYQTSGGYGFRDQLQDAIGMKYISTEILKNQIILHARHQFSEGDVEHWWHEDSNIGIRTRYSDDLLWLPYATIEYIKYTGDYSILKEQIEYLEDDELNKNQIDRVSIYEPKKHSGRLEKYSLLDHCIRAIERSLEFGKDGLPLINGGDWNDGMNCIGKCGKGESVWLGFFLYDILKKFTTLLKSEENFCSNNIISKDMEIDINQNNEVNRVDTDTIKNMNQTIDEIIQRYEEIQMKLKKVLNTVAWDGRWYKRAFDDDGREIGSIKNEECKIDSIAQSWSIISNAGDNDKKYIALESAEKYLIDNENNLIKLLTPSLENTNLGYITSYPKGTRENGGQYTHSAIWLLIAEIIMNSNNMAYEIYKKINPIEHTKNKQEVDKYKVEPYVVEADIYSEGALAGRGGWTWYTGSSSWLYTAQVEYILGIKIENDTMKIKPCVPDSWDKFNVNFKWNNAIYNIEYRRKIQKDTNEITEVKLSREGNYTIEVFY